MQHEGAMLVATSRNVHASSSLLYRRLGPMSTALCSSFLAFGLYRILVLRVCFGLVDASRLSFHMVTSLSFSLSLSLSFVRRRLRSAMKTFVR